MPSKSKRNAVRQPPQREQSPAKSGGVSAGEPLFAHRPGRALLRGMLGERNQWPERAEEIDQKLRAMFGRRAAVLVLDMSGFSQLTSKYGIIYYLSMVTQMEDVATPAVVKNGGHVFKQEADNLFAVF